MKLLLLFVGSTKEPYVAQGIDLYVQRTNFYAQLSISCTTNLKGISKSEEQRKQEGKQILKQLLATDYMVLLDEKGKSLTSLNFSKIIAQQQVHATKRMVFVICGAYGADNAVKERANLMLSMSLFTFSHQLARVVLAEQIYRGYTILHNHPYHNEG